MTELQIQYWSMVIQAIMGLVTALIGICGVLVGHFVLTRAKEREGLDAFWEKYAIKEGIEPLLLYTSTLEERIAEAYFKISRPDGEWDEKEGHLKRKIIVLPVPLTAMYRVVELTSCPEVLKVIFNGETYLEFIKDEESAKEMHSQILHLNGFLRTINMMFVISRIENRGDIAFTSSREAVMEAVKIFQAKIRDGKMETPEERMNVRILSTFNIFGESLKEKRKIVRSLERRKGEGKMPELP